MKQLLIKLEACEEALEWASNKTWEEVYNTCHRGDWLLWLHYNTNKKDLQVRTLAKGHCANTVKHLMKDERSLKAVDTAIAYGEGRATRKELNSTAAAYTAADADAAAYTTADADTAAYFASAAGAYAAAGAAYATGVAAYATGAAAAAGAGRAAKIKNQKETADIVRKYIPIELWNVNKMIDEVNKQI